MSRGNRYLSVVLGVLAFVGLGPLFVWDTSPAVFPAHAHDVLGAVPLTVVALAYLLHQGVRRTPAVQFAKAILSAVAFLFWALNQLLPDHPRATLFNDIAIAAFVLDVALVMVGWPPAAKETRDGGKRPVEVC